MWQQFMRLLSNHPEAIERLANSYVIRRMAQLTHYTYLKLMESTSSPPDKPTDVAGRLSSFARRFSDNIKKEIENSNKYQSKE